MKTEKLKTKSTLKKLLPFIKPYSLSFILAIIFIIAAAVIGSISPKTEGLITTQLANDVISIANGEMGAGVNFEFIKKILIILACLYVSNTTCLYLSNFLITHAIQNTMRDLRNSVENKIRKLPISYFDSNTFGDVLSRICNDVDTISNAMQQAFSQVINAILILSLSVFMMFTINTNMAISASLIIPISFLTSRFIVKKSQKLFENQQNALGRLNGKVQEMFTGFNEIKLYGKEEDSISDFKSVNEDLCVNGFKAQFISGLMSPMVSFITYIGIGAIAVMGSIYAFTGLVSVGNLQAFIRYIWQINQPLSQVTQLSSAMQSAFAAMVRVFEILDEKEETADVENPVKINNLKGNVTFDHVNFGYSHDKTLIEDLNADIKSGQMVAIVGPTGAGKTTLINLLMRFYDVNGGAIKIDGVDIRDMKRDDLRSMFGMVLQDTWLFNGTIHDNIEYGRFGASMDEIVSAAKTANVHHFIKTLPDGYNMFLNEEASNISIGEKQLLTIARAILSNPSILILDEATSSVDTRLELMLQNAMQNIMKGRTSFVIAHRLSTIKNADIILVMNEGNIIEQGSHDELISKKGFYEKLYNSQFAYKNV